MKHTRLILWAALAGALGITSCSGNSADPELIADFAFSDFAYYDTTGYTLVRYVPPASQSIQLVGEMVMDWERSFGETFTDVNSNGVYDVGIDSFMICACPENDDLNHNSQYDSPDPNDWSPGVPFDDINGDGQLAIEDYSIYNGYEPSRPFADVNENGVHDTLLSYNYRLYNPSLIAVNPGEALLVMQELNPAAGFVFTSDSGVTYELPPGTHRLPRFEFLFDDEGLHKTLLGGYTALLLARGATPESLLDQIVVGSSATPLTTYQRTVSSGQSLTIIDTTYTNLVRVSLTAPNPPQAGGQSFDEITVYFSRERGILAASCLDQSGDTEIWYFDQRYPPGSAPLPMAR